jgi:FlaA1/EpsC-like NDP-sugar epimerase
VMGTYNIARLFGPHMVLASTCKAADPETVYGCSKLVAERIALAAGGRVVRLVNVLHSPGSVTEIWNNTPVNESLPVCDATRLFIDKEQAMALLIGALTWPSGRYGPGVTRVQHMDDVAASLWPDRPLRRVPLRRGDRRHERLVAQCEQVHTWQPGVLRIVGPHDPATEEDDVHAAAVVQR